MKPLTDEYIENFIRDNSKDTQVISIDRVVGKSNRKRIKLTLKCKQDHTTEQLWDNFKKGHRCLQCSKNNHNKHKTKYSKDYVINKLYENGYELLGEYKDSGTSFRYLCLKCNNTGLTNFGNFLKGRRCQKCSGLSKKDTSTFKKEVEDMSLGEYSFIEKYETAHAKAQFKHNICGNKYYSSPHNFLGGKGCPRCSSSKGERKIESFFIKNKISYKTQYYFKDCRLNLPLKYDFAVFDEDNTLKLLIEYDGEQHFSPVDFFGGQTGYKKIQLRDGIKDNYCKKNDIELFRIPYWEFDEIERKLEGKLLE